MSNPKPPSKTEITRMLKPFLDANKAVEQANEALTETKDEVARAIHERIGSEQFRLGGVKYAAVKRVDKDDDGNKLEPRYLMKIYGQKEKKILDFG